MGGYYKSSKLHGESGTLITQAFVEFYSLHVYTSFYSIEQKIVTFDTVLWKITHARYRSYWSLHDGTVPVQVGSGYSTLLITAPCPINSVRVIQ